MVALVSNPRLNSYSDSGQPGLQCKTLHKKGRGGEQKKKCFKFLYLFYRSHHELNFTIN